VTDAVVTTVLDLVTSCVTLRNGSSISVDFSTRVSLTLDTVWPPFLESS
jgi:hypothetical protein